MDLAEFLAEITTDGTLAITQKPQRIAIHLPCTSQHGQSLQHALQQLISINGNQLTQVRDSHLCCGAAGTYSLFQPELSDELRQSRLQTLEEDTPDCIVTANIGCLLHLQAQAAVPVRHWIELFDSETVTDDYT